jgi:hypothetical protein
LDQVQEKRTGHINIGGYNRCYQTFTSGKSGSTKYIELYIKIPPYARLYLKLYYLGPSDWNYLGYSKWWHYGPGYYEGWVKFEFDTQSFPAGTKFKMIMDASDIEDEVTPPLNAWVEIFVGASYPDPGGPYPDGEFGIRYGPNEIPWQDLDATFRTYV